MTQDEALKLAEDYAHMRAIWYVESLYGTSASHTELREKVMLGAHQALKEALAQTQEPVAWMWDVNNGAGYSSKGIGFYQTDIPFAKHTPLYTTPPQRTWVGLEGEEIRNLWEEATKPDRSTMTMVTSFAKSIESKLKQKNGFAEENT